jgi:chorismate mutase
MDISNQLDELRLVINHLDESIVSSIARRQHISSLIGRLKQQSQVAIYDEEREQKLKSYHADLANKYELDLEMINQIFELIIRQSRQIQGK